MIEEESLERVCGLFVILTHLALAVTREPNGVFLMTLQTTEIHPVSFKTACAISLEADGIMLGIVCNDNLEDR